MDLAYSAEWKREPSLIPAEQPLTRIHDQIRLNNAELVIFSVDQSPCSVDNIRALLIKHWNVELIGSYKDKVEISWCIPAVLWSSSREIKTCVHYDQESILYLGPKPITGNRDAALYLFKSQQTKEVGHFMPVSYEEAMASDAWTLDPVSCTWYMCK